MNSKWFAIQILTLPIVTLVYFGFVHKKYLDLKPFVMLLTGEAVIQLLLCVNFSQVVYYASRDAYKSTALAFASTVNGCSDAFTRFDIFEWYKHHVKAVEGFNANYTNM